MIADRLPFSRGDYEPLRAAYEGVLARIEAACRRVGRDPALVSVLPITKGVHVERVGTAVMLGMNVLGENRVQEAEPKIRAFPGITSWELVGRLQSNKVAKAVELFDTIQSVDSIDLARRIGRHAVERDARFAFPIYLQVNVDRDPSKGGFEPEVLELELAELLELRGLEVRGLMTVGRQVDRAEEARPTYRRLRELSERLRRLDDRVGPELSMGMSGDFEVAVEEGSTVVRIGRLIFGARPPA